ncbi:ATP-dependent DNA helicase DinG [Facilibium subflavum]|uniref:ATP-dependent DNA helicase DinG n=1 Tax=Facilibium subflavum TaxID=2219058 RepID=UPI000E651679|nr:ATP-dependent DNA helicase DinG [Facilibium subflavum]
MQIESLFKSAGLHIRDAQLEMIQAIKKSLDGGQKLVVEAPTATGKSFAYILGALWANQSSLKGDKAQKNKKNIVISTATVALQEQLFFQDLPFIQKLLSENGEQKFTYMLAKGRSRYLCLRKLYHLEEKDDVVLKEAKDLENQFNKKWDGDFDNLEQPLNRELSKAIYNNSSACSFSRCEYYQDCPFFVARQGLRKTDIIVTNHSLLLSHLDLGDGAILPKFDQSIYIIDECHHLPDRALSAFSASATLFGSQSWINDVDKLLNALPVALVDRNRRQDWQAICKKLVQDLTQMQQYIDALYQTQEKEEGVWRIKSLDSQVQLLSVEIKKGAALYANQCDRLKSELEKFIEKSQIHSHESLEKQFTQLGFLLERAQNLQMLWALISNVQSTPPIAKWVSLHGEKNISTQQHELANLNHQDYEVHASPIEAASLLKQMFWDNVVNGVILCSATVRALGKFDRFLNATGLRNQADTLLLNSPLLYHHSTLQIADMKFLPNNQKDHIQETIKLFNEQYLQGFEKGVLVLFTSIYAMEAVYQGLLPSIKRITQVQGDRSKQMMISLHKKRIDSLKPSVIFGVDSFCEGVDLPGDYLARLIIHKLPFSVPTNPIDKTRAEWLLSMNRKPFIDMSLPQSSLKLTQMVGRLVRTETDIGEVIILDKRLKTKFYGKSLLENLPPFKII